jgi:hypothetical protein
MSRSRMPHGHPAHAITPVQPYACPPAHEWQPGLLPQTTGRAAFAAFSTAPTTLPDAQDEVLSALLQDTACPAVFGAAASESTGDAVVAVSEVRLALRSLPSHRAPGEDGLPLELWRLADGTWAPMLARLYSAMFQLQCTPCRFTLGRIMPLHKGNSMCQASNYRPSRSTRVATRCWPACLRAPRPGHACLHRRGANDVLAWQGNRGRRLPHATGRSETVPYRAAWGRGPAEHCQGFRHH